MPADGHGAPWPGASATASVLGNGWCDDIDPAFVHLDSTAAKGAVRVVAPVPGTYDLRWTSPSGTSIDMTTCST